MTYRVEREVLSRDPNAPELPMCRDALFDVPQDAVTFARDWVVQFTPEANGSLYTSDDLPRARVVRQGKFKGLAVIFNCWKRTDGAIQERRNV